ncbi:carbohydrate-responsive element-binding protein [Protopterus annectens]|uniref:carbohydrate-responsive element-binding protein n=1 Tax=Protopterus annectens TaxID=7888 RepID=UPI001CFA65F5|nr:carbohydrate-responsive element-binding protein [Protopterus annectens]
MDHSSQLNSHQLTPGITSSSGIPDFHCNSTARLSQSNLFNSSALPLSSCPHSGAVSLHNSPPNSVPTPLLTPTSGPSPTGPLVIPKREKLSPVSTCVNSRRNSGLISPAHSTAQSHSPQSPHSTPNRSKLDLTKTETRRITHISAEQKRRFNIKLGFDTLHNFVTSLSPQPSIKVM